MERHPDLELARRAAGGEEAAWRDIYDATRQRLFALLAFHTGSRQEARDLLQETYLAAVRGIRRYRGRGSLEAWLCGIALRRARSWRRELRRMAPRSRTEAVPAGGEAAAGLREALARLTERQRCSLLLHEWMGLGFAEVGHALGIREATARVHCHRGKEALRTMLDAPRPELAPQRAREIGR